MEENEISRQGRLENTVWAIADGKGELHWSRGCAAGCDEGQVSIDGMNVRLNWHSDVMEESCSLP